MAKNKAAEALNVVPITVEFREVDGVRTAFATAAWPQFTAIAVAVLETLKDIATLDTSGDAVTFHVANGSATYRRFSTGVDAKAGETIFKLAEGTFAPVDPEQNSGAGTAPEALDTAVDDADAGDIETPMRLSERITAAVRDAVKASDHPRHAALHQLESAIGEFKRRCQDGVGLFDEGSDERDILTSIANEL